MDMNVEEIQQIELMSKSGRHHKIPQILTNLLDAIEKGRINSSDVRSKVLAEYGCNSDILDCIEYNVRRHLEKRNVWRDPAASTATPVTIEQFDISDVVASIQDNIFNSVSEKEIFFAAKITEASFNQLNDALVKNKAKRLSYKDLAIIWAAFSHNVASNDNGGCPQTSIIALTQEHVEVENPYSTLHVKAAISIFIKMKMAIISTPHNHFKHQGTCYKLL